LTRLFALVFKVLLPIAQSRWFTVIFAAADPERAAGT